jgi:hypothetical protein
VSTVFISYRRENTAGEALLLFNELVARLGEGSVFMDVASIRYGRDFRKELEQRLASCDLVLALIGREWADVKDQAGRTRISNPDDFVRVEIETALKRDIVVTPVLVQDARMPAAEQLPSEIRDLVYRNAVELRHIHWKTDVEEMIRGLGLGGPSVPAPPQKIKRWAVWALVPALLIIALLVGLWKLYAQTLKLAVINTNGEVWARDLSDNTIGPSVKLTGPSLFGGSDDRYVLGFFNSISVVTELGAVWPRKITDTTVGASSKLSGSLFGGADTKYVLNDESCDLIFVVNTSGEVWGHSISSSSVDDGFRLNGPSLFEGRNEKYLVFDVDGSNKRILVVNTAGEVWAHDLSRVPNTFCGLDGIGAGYKLSGPGLFGAPNDKYVLAGLYVVNTSGEVWRHGTTHSAVGDGVKLNGPTLFGARNDKYVVTYIYSPLGPRLRR